METEKRDKRGLLGVIPRSRCASRASNRIPDRNPDKVLANSAANVRMTARNVAAVLPMGDKLSLNSPRSRCAYRG